ncbi:MAG TPA: VanZ family protein [Clostridiales bacterium]|nr:VanZ family protein [Clostridiales bacterium]
MYLENNRSDRQPIRPAFAWILVLLWMLIIFLLSAQDGSASGQLSNNIAGWLYNLFTGQSDPEGITAFEGVLRQIAHGGAYFVLAILVSLALSRSGISDIRHIILTLVICALYAGSDEWHQSFVPGRAAELKDYAVDLAGAVLGVLLYQGASAIGFLRQQRFNREEET